MNILENVELSPLSYMKVGGQAKYLIEIEEEDELKKITEIITKEKLPVVVLGDCSNTILNNNFHNKIFLKILTTGIIKTYEDKNAVNISVDAGTNWNELVRWTVRNKYSGLELLSGIPGSAGACPIQNIGAYGTEVSDVLTFVRIFDFETNDFYELTNTDCQFGYRSSILKENLGKFIVTNVSFRLSKKKPEIPQYKDLSLYFLKEKNKEPTIKHIMEAVLDIRNTKLPDPKKNPNCGSFFKNPIVDNVRAQELLEHFPDMPQFKMSEDEVKISGGWLIEKSGFKGKKFGNLRVDDRNALVLISNGKATFKEIEDLSDKIIRGVEKNFGIRIEVEPSFVY